METEINTAQALFSGQKNGEMETKFLDQPLAHLVRDLIFKSKDNRRRSEVNDGEVRCVH